MPVVPIVRQKDFDTALKNAIQVEGKRNNTAIIHSQNVSRLSEAAKKIKTTIFVKNAPSYVGLGFEGEGYVGFTIAGRTGEGIVSAKDFARRRRCVLSGSFSIRWENFCYENLLIKNFRGIKIRCRIVKVKNIS